MPKSIRFIRKRGRIIPIVAAVSAASSITTPISAFRRSGKDRTQYQRKTLALKAGAVGTLAALKTKGMKKPKRIKMIAGLTAASVVSSVISRAVFNSIADYTKNRNK